MDPTTPAVSDASSASAMPAPETFSPAGQAVVDGDVSGYRRARREERRTGIRQPLVTKPAASSAAAPAAPASSTEERSTPASEPGTPAAPASKPNADTRKQELAGEIDQLLARRKALRDEIEQDERRRDTLRTSAGSQPAAASTTPPPATPAATPTKAEWERFKAMPDAPQLKDFENYEDYQLALTVFVADKRDADRQTRAQEATTQAEHERALAKVADTWRTKVDKAKERHDDFVKVALEAPTDIQPGSTIDGWILESEEGAEVLYYLQSTKGEVARINALSPVQQVRELMKIEAKLAAPPPKHVSSAPAPVTTVSGRGNEPTDPMTAAIASGDTAAYRRLKREQRLAAAGH